MRDGQGTVTEPLNQIIYWVLTKFHHVRISNLETSEGNSLSSPTLLPFAPAENRQKTTENWVLGDNKRCLFSHLNIWWPYVASVCRLALRVVMCVSGRLAAFRATLWCVSVARKTFSSVAYTWISLCVCRTDTEVTGWDGTESAGWQEDCFHSKSLIKNLAVPQRPGEGECVSESLLVVSHEENVMWYLVFELC